MLVPSVILAVSLASIQADRVPFDESAWRTDFSKRSVPLSEIRSGGPPKDGIPAIDRPRFESVRKADRWLEDREPVIVYEHDGDARAYPLQILIWHEIANDRVGGRPVAITFCPLCNTAIAFDRRVGDRVLDFGTTGKLRHSDLVMYDRQTESWWQQATGEAIVGEWTGTRLEFLPAPTVTWREFKRAHPKGRVLSRETGHERPYGRNPYRGYDTKRPIFPVPSEDDRLPMMARVVIVQAGDSAVAYPLERLAEERAVNHAVGSQPIVVFYEEGTRSALDAAQIADSRAIGSGVAYRRSVDGRVLTFRAGAGGLFVDAETGSTWDLGGRAVAGPLAGKRLGPAVHFIPFWFAWAAFEPGTPIYGAR